MARMIREFVGVFDNLFDARQAAHLYQVGTWGYFGRASISFDGEAWEVWGSRSTTCD